MWPPPPGPLRPLRGGGGALRARRCIGAASTVTSEASRQSLPCCRGRDRLDGSDGSRHPARVRAARVRKRTSALPHSRTSALPSPNPVLPYFRTLVLPYSRTSVLSYFRTLVLPYSRTSVLVPPGHTPRGNGWRPPCAHRRPRPDGSTPHPAHASRPR